MKSETYDRLRSKLKFDPMSFDDELIDLPMLIMEASEKTSELVLRRDQAKDEVDVAIAKASDELRQEPIEDAKGNPKTRSEAQISSEALLYVEVQEAQQRLHDCKYEVALWQALCDSLRTKRDTMRTYAELTTAGYLTPNAILTRRRAEIREASASVRRPLNRGQ